MRKFRVGLIFFILFLLISTQLILPNAVSKRIKASLDKEINKSAELSLELSSFPALKLLIGRVDELIVVGEGLVVDSLPISKLNSSFKDLKLKQVEGKWKVIKGKNDYLDLELSEEGLNKYLNTRPELDIFENFKVELLKNKVMLVGDISFFNAQVNIQLSGNFNIAGPQTIVFSSDKLALENIVIPTALIEQLKDKLQFEIDLSQLPIPLEINQIILEEDRLSILGKNQ
ncbi:LmeA family phospholipid-binding protein [Orenia marismortui]|uniref:LmeA family phospholipid-binding protein n=1 Tax=Orenia marismortui TaxID=46469 RepID=UPI00037DC718|nr:DUF2993 domain-containing protein [Orenia marismortui]